MSDFNTLILTKTIDILPLNEQVLKQINSQIATQLNTGVLVLDANFNVVIWNRFLQIHTDKVVKSTLGKSIF
ncbi:MAG: hypothetical protein ACI952_001232, partial [Flavobacteriales bacterium]